MVRCILSSLILGVCAEESLMQFEKAGAGGLDVGHGATRLTIMQHSAQEVTDAYSKLLQDIVDAGSLVDPTTGRPYVPSLNIINATKVEFEELEEELKRQQNLNQGILNDHAQSVRDCNIERSSRFAGSTGVVNLMKSMQAMRTAHGDCRTSENGAIVVMEASCDTFARLQKCEIKDQNWYAVPATAGDFSNSLMKVIDQAVDCRKEVATVTQWAGDCDTKQDSFKAAACTYEEQLSDTCTKLNNCYDIATKNHNKAKLSITKLEEEQKTMYRMVKRVHCYLDLLWRAAESQGIPTIDEIKACNDLAPDSTKLDDSDLDINKQTDPDRDLCGFEDEDVVNGKRGHSSLVDGDGNQETISELNQPGTDKWYEGELEEYNTHGVLQDNSVCR